jgi:hypothetical protein
MFEAKKRTVDLKVRRAHEEAHVGVRGILNVCTSTKEMREIEAENDQPRHHALPRADGGFVPAQRGMKGLGLNRQLKISSTLRGMMPLRSTSFNSAAARPAGASMAPEPFRPRPSIVKVFLDRARRTE